MNLNLIISECINNKPKAQKELFDLFYKDMIRVALYYSKNEDDAKSIVIESFTDVFKNINTLHDHSKIKAWIKKITIFKAINFLKKNNLINQREISNYENYDIEDTKHDIFKAKYNPEFLLSLINALPDLQRVIFNMYAIDGFSHAEIADHLKISNTSSRWHYMTARKTLQNQLLQYTQNQLKHVGSI